MIILDKKKIGIAIDGPSGAGKSTIAKHLAKKYGFIYVDTGALYRAIGLYIKRHNVASKDVEGVVSLLPEISLRLSYADGAQRVFLNDEDVSGVIRTPEISMYASDVSAMPKVREFLLGIQRDMFKTNNVIMDGRDIGTVIMPDADVKIFLTASPEERAKRRFEELKEAGQDVSFENVLSDVIRRDNNDSTRSAAPLREADDAIHVDTTGNTFEESAMLIDKIIKGRIGNVL